MLHAPDFSFYNGASDAALSVLATSDILCPSSRYRTHPPHLAASLDDRVELCFGAAERDTRLSFRPMFKDVTPAPEHSSTGGPPCATAARPVAVSQHIDVVLLLLPLEPIEIASVRAQVPPDPDHCSPGSLYR